MVMPSEVEVVIAKLKALEDDAIRLEVSIRHMILELREGLDN